MSIIVGVGIVGFTVGYITSKLTNKSDDILILNHSIDSFIVHKVDENRHINEMKQIEENNQLAEFTHPTTQKGIVPYEQELKIFKRDKLKKAQQNTKEDHMSPLAILIAKRRQNIEPE